MNAVTMRVNGAELTKAVEPRTHLADFIREELQLTATHIGCEHGVCGACTMIVDGRPVRSCITFAASCHGADVRTLEGLEDDPVLVALRGAFTRHHALQCGYCTPGMLATAYDIVTRLPSADSARIREELAGNLCRCTGYVGIVKAIEDVLASGPYRTSHPPVERSLMASPTVAAVIAPVAESPVAAPPLPVLSEPIDGVTLARSIDVAVPVGRLWTTLQDIATVARCLPGATIEAIADDGVVAGLFTVAIGPMRIAFRGQAQTAFDDTTRSGSVTGSGGDGRSRSSADGAIRFAALPAGDAASRLELDITYRLNGPLAQFGRPAVVADVVDRLLVRFAANLGEAAEGGTIAPSAPIGGIGMAWNTLLAALRRLISGK